MDKLMDSPWFLRFTALAIAIIIFVSVKSEDASGDGNATGDRLDIINDVPVEVYYDNENLVVTGVPETVNMTIEGPANIVQTTKLLKDFTLKVDLHKLPMGQHTVKIQHENISDKLQVRIDPAVINVVVEEKITQTFRVDPEMNERLLAEDFQVVKMEVEPTTIEVTGAKSVIDSISFVKASVTGDPGIDRSFDQKANVRVLDRDLNKLNVQIVPEQVTVKVEVEEYNKEVPLSLKVRGTEDAEVTINSVTTEEKSIKLYGPRKVLDQIISFDVDVDVSQVKGQETLDIELKKPKGISKISLQKIKVKVDAVSAESEENAADQDEAGIEGTVATATKEIQNVPITVKGLDKKYKSSFIKPASGTVALTVTADQNVIDSLKNTDFTVYVDASSTMDEGEQSFTVSVDGPEKTGWKLSEEVVMMNIELA